MVRSLVAGFVVLSAVGCSSSTTEPAQASDAATHDAAVDTGPSFGTTGIPCTADDECAPADAGATAPFCSTSLAAGSLYPAPVCLGAACDPGDGDVIVGCDKNAGLCLPTSSGGICIPGCDFGGDGAAPVGCLEGALCTPYGWGQGDKGEVVGVGYCYGGCRSDDDCPRAGERCQVEEALCVRSVVTYLKALGEACVRDDATSTPPKCNCLTGREGTGYCTKVCRFGEACDPGFTCDPMLPKTFDDGSPAFAAVPAGVAGYCLKDCASDADCAAFGGHCDENAGTGKKTCQLGPRS